MKIHAGFTLGYECPQPTPMLLVLSIHPSRRGDLLTDQVLTFDRPITAGTTLTASATHAPGSWLPPA